MTMNELASRNLAALEDRGEFLARHIGTSPAEQSVMLAMLGYSSRAALMDAIVPAAIRESAPLPLPGPLLLPVLSLLHAANTSAAAATPPLAAKKPRRLRLKPVDEPSVASSTFVTSVT